MSFCVIVLCLIGRSISLMQMIAAGGVLPFVEFVVGLPWQPIGRLDIQMKFDAS
jgi:hypothetical protein